MKKKILSIILCIALAVGIIPVSQKVMASGEEDGVYYVSATGSAEADGKTQSTPVDKLSTALDKIKADGNNVAEKNVTIKIDGTQGNVTYDMKAHECNITYTSLGETRAKIYMGNKKNIEIQGPSVFDSIDFTTNYTSTKTVNARRIFTAGHTVDLRNVNYYQNDTKLPITNENYLTLVAGSPNYTENGTVPGTTLKITNTVVDEYSARPYIYIGTTNYPSGTTTASTTYTGDVNLYFDNATTESDYIGTKISFAMPKEEGYNTFQKNINIVLENGTRVKEIRRDTENTQSDTTRYPVVHGAIQYILNNGSTLDTDGTVTVPSDKVKNLAFKTESKEESADVYCLYSPAGSPAKLDVVADTAGEYTVTEGYQATATLVSDASVSYTSQNGILTVAQPGNYTVTYAEVEEEAEDNNLFEYYLTVGGTGAGRIESDPAGDIATVIGTINEDGHGQNANVTVVLDSTGQPETYSNEEVLKFFGYQSAKETAKKYDCTITFMSKDASNPAVMAFNTSANSSADNGKDYHLYIAGNTVFKDIILLDNSNTGKRNIFCQDYRVHFDNVVHKRVGSEGGLVAKDNDGDTSDAIFKLYTGAEASGTSQGTVLTIDSTDTLKNNGGVLMLGTTGSEKLREYEGDVNVIINGGDTRFGIMIQSKANAVFDKNVNIVLNAVTSLRANGISTNGIASINGALQIILNQGSSVNTVNGNALNDIAINALKADESTATPVYLLYSEEEGVALNYTDVAGTYKVEGNKQVIAICREDGSYTYSQDGILTVPQAGSYDVSLMEDIDYIHAGDVIEVLKDTIITFADITHKEKEGYFFVGWKDGDDYVEDGKFTAGTKLIAEYVPFDKASDFVITGTELRGEGNKGLRFVVKNTNVISEAVNVNEVGTVVIPTDALKDKAEVECDKTVNGVQSVSVEAERIITHARTYKEYTVCITNIRDYERFYTVRAYVKYTDNNGVDRILYSERKVSSAYNTAAELSVDAVAKLNNTEKVFYDEIMNAFETSKATYKAQSTRDVLGSSADAKSWIYKLENGVYVREATINSNKPVNTPTTIVQITDLHFNYLNALDDKENNPTVIASSKKRTWGSKNTINALKTLEYGRYFGDATVVTGDTLDYLTWGAIEMMEKSIWDRYPNTLVTLGNHEDDMEVGQHEVKESLSLEVRRARLEKVWNANNHNMHYESKLVNDNVLIIAIDNGNGHYDEGEIELLTADIQRARENNYTVLLFQHQPISTGNPDDVAVVQYSDEGEYDPTKMENPTDDLYNLTGKLGDKDTAADKAIYELITNNADVIRGVFTGHKHGDMYSEIKAKDSQGNDKTIPQYVLTSSVYSRTADEHPNGTVLKITVR